MISINLVPEDLALIAFIILAIIEALVVKHYYKKSEEYHREIHMMVQASQLKPVSSTEYIRELNNEKTFDPGFKLASNEPIGTPTYGTGEAGFVTIDEKTTTTKIKK